MCIIGTRQGYLYKRKKEADEWRNRWFNLTHDYLSYKIAYLVHIQYSGTLILIKDPYVQELKGLK